MLCLLPAGPLDTLDRVVDREFTALMDILHARLRPSMDRCGLALYTCAYMMMRLLLPSAAQSVQCGTSSTLKIAKSAISLPVWGRCISRR